MWLKRTWDNKEYFIMVSDHSMLGCAKEFFSEKKLVQDVGSDVLGFIFLNKYS